MELFYRLLYNFICKINFFLINAAIAAESNKKTPQTCFLLLFSSLIFSFLISSPLLFLVGCPFLCI